MAYHLTADYTWGWTQEESMKNATEALGLEDPGAGSHPGGRGRLQPVSDPGAELGR